MIHLHVHSEYSLRDSLVRIEDLCRKTKELGMNAVALTDHGNLSGALEFYVAARDAGIKPIIGLEAYIVADMDTREKGEKRHHIVLLAMGEHGYSNLVKLASIAGTQGFYYVPRIDLSVLKRYCKGLIALSACSGSSVLYMLGNPVNRIVRVLDNMFGERLFLEIMPHDNRRQKEHNMLVCDIGDKYGIPIVATQDVHYLEPASSDAHDVLMKIQGRDPYGNNTYCMSDGQEIKRLFSKHTYLPSRIIKMAIGNTEVISEMVKEFEIPLGTFVFPKYNWLKGG